MDHLDHPDQYRWMGGVEVEVKTEVHKHVHTLGGVGWAILLVIIILSGIGITMLFDHMDQQTQVIATNLARQKQLEDEVIAMRNAKQLDYNHVHDLESEIQALTIATQVIGRCRK